MSNGRVRSEAAEASSEECGCAPSAAEARAFWPNTPLTRRGAFAVGAVGIAAAATGIVASRGSLAFAADGYPTWDDVQRAKANEAAKGAEITRIEGLIQRLAADVAETQRLAEIAADEYYVAQQEYFEAAEYAEQLQAQADEQAALANDASRKAGQVAAQLYRSGGDDTALQLFFSGSGESADDLLSSLGRMDKLLEHNRSIYDNAVAARNLAQQLTDQAEVARIERDRLQKEAEAKLIKAEEAAARAQAALDRQTEHLITLEAQLAALRDTTAQTVAGYEAGVAERKRIAEEKRKADEARRQREAEERARAEREAANSGSGNSGGGNSGGGSGGTGGSVGSSGWARPHGGRISSWYGRRTSKCNGRYCSSSNHLGLDFANGCGAYIYAASSGRVDIARYNGGYGNYIRIQHGNGIATGYAHIRSGGFLVSNGQEVSAGQAIAYAGDTGNSFGCHLHFEVYVNGPTTDPAPFLRNRGVSV